MKNADSSPRLASIGLGSNLDEPERQIDQAVRLLTGLSGCRVIAESSRYRSAPFGPVEQPDFINAVVTIETLLAPRDLLQALQGIEIAMGRRSDVERWGPRIIDLDLLTLGDECTDLDDLVIPHPGISERNFVLLPLQEIAPQLVIPGLGRVADIVVNQDELRIERIE